MLAITKEPSETWEVLSNYDPEAGELKTCRHEVKPVRDEIDEALQYFEKRFEEWNQQAHNKERLGVLAGVTILQEIHKVTRGMRGTAIAKNHTDEWLGVMEPTKIYVEVLKTGITLNNKRARGLYFGAWIEGVGWLDIYANAKAQNAQIAIGPIEIQTFGAMDQENKEIGKLIGEHIAKEHKRSTGELLTLINRIDETLNKGAHKVQGVTKFERKATACYVSIEPVIKR